MAYTNNEWVDHALSLISKSIKIKNEYPFIIDTDFKVRINRRDTRETKELKLKRYDKVLKKANAALKSHFLTKDCYFDISEVDGYFFLVLNMD